MANPTLEAAIEYVEKYKFSVIPLIPGDKKPSIKWEPFQTRRPEKSNLITWFGNNPKANIGIVTGKVSNLFVIDLDKYAEGYDQAITDQYIPESTITPTVETARGGQHLYFNDPGGDFTIRARALPGIDFRGNNGYVVAPPSMNGTGKPWKWTVGCGLDVPRAEAPDKFLSLLKDINKSTLYTRADDNAENNSRQMSSVSSNVVKMFEYGRRDEDLFHTANVLVKGGMPKEEIAQILERIINSWGEESDPKWIKTKIESALGRSGRRERNLTEEVREWVLSSSGVFLSSEIVKCLHLSSRDEAKNLSTVLRRLCAEEKPLIERHGTKNGQFKILDQSEELIDWKNADITPLDIKFPLKVHEYVQVHKGNVIVIAGESNAGKTAYCLNMALRNSAKYKINYLSSEMQDGTELRLRLKEFQMHDSVWDPVKFQFRTDNFPEKIDPDGINIIDYLDEGTDSEAYKMPMRIRLIADRLKTGIAVVAIQKDPQKQFGFGGAGTLNRSRVYLTIKRPGILTIEKAKIWRDKLDNPNGKWLEFKLVAGCRFLEDGSWQNPKK
jgi:hypothetical protein